MSVDEARYGAGWRPTEAKSYKVEDRNNGVFVRPGVPIEVPTDKGEFTVVLSKYGSRDILPPEGYKLPSALDGMWVTLSDAIKAIRKWEDTGEQLSPIEEPQIALPLSEADKEILQRKGGKA
jgi:hypothetical protein